MWGWAPNTVKSSTFKKVLKSHLRCAIQVKDLMSPDAVKSSTFKKVLKSHLRCAIHVKDHMSPDAVEVSVRTDYYRFFLALASTRQMTLVLTLFYWLGDVLERWAWVLCSRRIVSSYEIVIRDCMRCKFACLTKLVCVGLVSGLSYNPSSSDPRLACQRV